MYTSNFKIQHYKPQLTIDAYADLGESFDSRYLLNKTIRVKNTGASNAVKYIVYGSLDGETFDVIALAEQTLAAATAAKHHINDYYIAVKIQIKASVGSSQSTVEADIAGIDR